MTSALTRAWRTAFATLLVCTAGYAVAHRSTDGFSAFTLEAARRVQALRAPVAVPDFALESTEGGGRLSDVPGRVLLVDFVYTRCTSYCQVMGAAYARLQQRLAPEIAAGSVGLLTVSFDPARDSLEALRDYRAHHSRQVAGWTLGRPPEADALPRILAAFGVVVIPDGSGGFAHNAAFHVLGPGRRLVAIHDLGDVDGVVTTVHAMLDAEHVARR